MTWQYQNRVEIFKDADGYTRTIDDKTQFVAFSNEKSVVVIGTYTDNLRNYGVYDSNGNFRGIGGHGKLESLSYDPSAKKRLDQLNDFLIQNPSLESRLSPVKQTLQQMQ